MENELLSTLLQVLLETIITVALPIVLTHLVLWINSQIKNTRAQMSKEQLALTEMLVKQFVRAAEQSGLSGQIKAAGAEKKAYVLALIRAELEERQISINLEVLDAMIEAAVNDAFGKIELDPSAAAG
jgi:LL-H family phage holin